jgi:hypothetical protein
MTKADKRAVSQKNKNWPQDWQKPRDFLYALQFQNIKILRRVAITEIVPKNFQSPNQHFLYI